MVGPDCLPRDVIFVEGKISVWCVHGDNVDYPIAEVPIQVEGQQYLLAVGVMEKLPYQVVLGRDLPVLYDLIAKQSQGRASEGMVAVTRSRGRHAQSVPARGGMSYLLLMMRCQVLRRLGSLESGKAGGNGGRTE